MDVLEVVDDDDVVVGVVAGGRPEDAEGRGDDPGREEWATVGVGLLLAEVGVGRAWAAVGVGLV